MAVMRVNPTRMELSRLKKRLKTAMRGHKLLKDKRDELMKQFLEIIKENRSLRIKVENALGEAQKSIMNASAVISSEALEVALMYPKQSVTLHAETKNIMSVDVPVYTFETLNNDKSEIFSYGFAQTSAELDFSLSFLSEVFEEMLKLAQLEKTIELLSAEIEKTRRRVNALEYVLIPSLRETIKSITGKLEENERGNLTRLMKVKLGWVEPA